MKFRNKKTSDEGKFKAGAEKVQAKKPPKIDKTFIGVCIKRIFEFTEPIGKKVLEQCSGEVVAVKRGNMVHVK